MYRKRHKRGKRLASVFLTVAMITAAVPAQAAEFSTPDSFEQIFSSGAVSYTHLRAHET